MSTPSDPFDDPLPSDPEEAAALWTLRLDRGLTPAEQDAYTEWLAADPRHGQALQRLRAHWGRLDTLADWKPEHARRPNPDLLAPTRARPRRGWGVAVAALATAACVALMWQTWRPAVPVESVAAASRHEDRRLLPDGSTAKLGAGADVEIRFSAHERRLVLRRGQAFFMVRPDAARPFVVDAGGVTVRAVGTAFDVRLGDGEVAVVVAEGRVAVMPGEAASAGPATDAPAAASGPAALVGANQQISVPIRSEGAPVVATLTRQDVQQRLAWQHGLMTFRQKPLAEIVEELNWLNDTQLVLLDEALAATRFSGTIRSDNLAGFARLLETGFGARIEQADAAVIRLRTKKESN